MDDSWLAHGHGSEPVHLDTIFSSTARNRPVPLDPASDPTEQLSIGAGRTPRRSSRLAVVTALWFGIIVGTSGAAWAVRDALFPSIGPAQVSVWQNPGHDTDPSTTDDERNTTIASTTATSIAASTAEASTATSVEAHESNDDRHNSTSPVADDGGTKHGDDSTQPTVAVDTPSSVDDHGGGQGGSGPSDDTAPDDGSGSGKGSDAGGGSGSGGHSGSGGGSDG